MLKRPSVCVIHQSLADRPGGAGSVCAWVLQALKDDCDVSLFSPDERVDLDWVNGLYGTRLAEGDVRFVKARLPYWMESVPPGRLKSLRLAYITRDFSARAAGFDFAVSTMNELCLPIPSLLYVHCPIRSYRTIKALYGRPERWLRLGNDILFKAVSGFSTGRFGPHASFVTNSAWSKRALAAAYGIEASVIYPPVVLEDATCPGPAGKEDGFVTISRLEPDKRVHDAIHIVDMVRGRMPGAHLHIVGFGSGEYAGFIRRMADERDYVTVHGELKRAELARLVGMHRYGLHVTRNEHFGMAPAEMAAAGALVFVHDSGGQVEVVDDASELKYGDAEEAAAKILAVAGDERLKKELLARLEKSCARFTAESFVDGIRARVDAALKTRRGHAA